MKPKILVNFLLPVVIFYATVIADGIGRQVKDKRDSDKASSLNKKRGKDGNLKSNSPATQWTLEESRGDRGILRPESSGAAHPKQGKCVGKAKDKRMGCEISHSCMPCCGGAYGGACAGSCAGGCGDRSHCCCCHHECDEGCWCPIPGADTEPEKKPEEPCCCPCCCPCCPTPCCHDCHDHHCCQHHVYHHHCCPCCHHCCHCCPCCCHCCHCCHCHKKSQGPLAPSLLKRPQYMFIAPIGLPFAGAGSYYGLLAPKNAP